MQSLKTTSKREAEMLSRRVSVDFDTICQGARVRLDVVQDVAAAANHPEDQRQRDVEAVMAQVPHLMRLAAARVVEEQIRDPKGWKDTVKRWKSFYEAMRIGQVPSDIQQPPLHAQAYLNGIELAIRGQSIPEVHSEHHADATIQSAESKQESWNSLCVRALAAYSQKVSAARHQLAKSKLSELHVHSTADHQLEVALNAWCDARLQEVKPRTVKTQLDCMVAALRCARPKLQTPQRRDLIGVMQPRVDDRQSMPVQAIRDAIEFFKNRPANKKVRHTYDGGASQFDAIAIETLATLGIRPRELAEAKSDAICTKTNVFGKEGLYFRIAQGKNKASEREIPLSDGKTEILNIGQLKEMLAWQERNLRSPHGRVSALQTRFLAATKKHTLYQMRHSWKDIAVQANIDFELRERLLGHKVIGIASIYGSGIPLEQGIAALNAIRIQLLGLSH